MLRVLAGMAGRDFMKNFFLPARPFEDSAALPLRRAVARRKAGPGLLYMLLLVKLFYEKLFPI